MTNDYLPITYGHDYSRPIGHAEVTDGEIRLMISKEAKIKMTPEMIERLNMVFAPTYEIAEVQDGFVTEVRVLGFALVPGSGKL